MTGVVFDPGPKPDLRWLPVAKLSVDERYQRTLESRRSQNLVEALVARFRWSAFQAILAANRPGGGWYVIDGQHRVSAARRLAIKEVPAVVVSAASMAEQAAAFVQANLARVTVNAFALHHANLAARAEDALQINRICKAVGLTIPRYPIPADKLKPGETLALATIGRLAKLYGEEEAILTLRSVTQAYAAQAGGLRAPVFLAAGLLIKETHPSAREQKAARLVSFLKTVAPDALFTRARRYGRVNAASLHAVFKGGVAVSDRGASGSSVAPSRARLMGAR